MKLTKRQLKQLIKEELDAALYEAGDEDVGPQASSDEQIGSDFAIDVKSAIQNLHDTMYLRDWKKEQKRILRDLEGKQDAYWAYITRQNEPTTY